ncbi:MAG: CDP-alcohol phosphatidyltransferase family protein [Pseudonocardia sp.]
MPPPYPSQVRLLPNAVTVLALCAGLSAVQFALAGNFQLCVASVGVAALCDALDGRLARLLDATSRIGAELDSLADLVSFGVAPALVLYIWQGPAAGRFGWVVALVFAVCMALRLARFNTLIDATDPYPFTKEFFVGVPAPAAALVAGIPLYLFLHLGPGWWSAAPLVGGWALVVAMLMVSRLPTMSLKTLRVPPQLIAPLLGLVGVAAAVLFTAPFLGLAVVSAGYVALLPYTLYRYRWLARHPEAWDVPLRERRAVARAARSARRLGLRPPLRRRVAGRATAMARAVRRRSDENGAVPDLGGGPAGRARRGRLGLRRARRR